MRHEWLAPKVQPFFVSSARDWPSLSGGAITPELDATYQLWRIPKNVKPVWMNEAMFMALPRERRIELVRQQLAHFRGAVPTARAWSDLLDANELRAQADGHRFVWWPSLVDDRVMERVASRSPTGRERALPESRHAEVRTWPRRVSAARPLAGTFASAGGANCFATVMAATGMAGAADQAMLIEPFEQWLATACRPGGNDLADGTVLVWRDTRTQASAHAAITLGDGWAFEKPSGDWWTKRVVLRVEDLKRGNRVRGWRLERHRLL